MSNRNYWEPGSEPLFKLNRHIQLCPHAGARVSPVILRPTSMGDDWQSHGIGATDKESIFQLMDAYCQGGGNFIDATSDYQDETSELIVGEWLERRDVRNRMVIATKYIPIWKRGQNPQQPPQRVQYSGDIAHSLRSSVEASLKKLRTTYIDILYVYWRDFSCSIEEVMTGLHNLVVQGKVLYLGIAATPAWVVAKANMYARLTGKTPFVIYQGSWSILQRDVEREILPMVGAEGMALAPYNVLAGGKICTDIEERSLMQSGAGGQAMFASWPRTEAERTACQALEKVAREVGATSITTVAIAWMMQKEKNVLPSFGGGKVEQLLAKLEALRIRLSPDIIKFLDNAVPFDKGFPYTDYIEGRSR